MICDPQPDSCSEQSLIVSHIGAQIEELCNGLPTSMAGAEDVARAIEFFLKEEGDEEFVDSNMLALLAARALSSIGDHVAARRMVVFGTGMVRPSEWVVTGERTIWVLDLKEMTVRDDASLELVFFKSIQVVMDSIADVWDESRGEGTLGLRHICSVASMLLGGATRTTAVKSLGLEIVDVCISKLNRIRVERGWEFVPEVMNVDV